MAGPDGQADLLEIFSAVPHPELNRAIAEMGMLSGVRKVDGKLEVEIQVNSLEYELLNVLKSDIMSAAERHGEKAEVKFIGEEFREDGQN